MAETNYNLARCLYQAYREYSEWRRSVIKRGSGSVRSSHQTVSDYILRQWFPNSETVI